MLTDEANKFGCSCSKVANTISGETVMLFADAFYASREAAGGFSINKRPGGLPKLDNLAKNAALSRQKRTHRLMKIVPEIKHIGRIHLGTGSASLQHIC